MFEARRPFPSRSLPPLDEQTRRPGILELDQRISIPSGVADDQIAGEIAEERVLERNSIVAMDVSAVGRHVRGEMMALAKERQDLPLLIKDGVLGEPFA